jgi:hypothetical protein
VLRGVNLPSLIFADSVIDFGTLPLFKEDVKIVKDWGATFAVISYDPYRVAHRPYAEKIVEAVEYTRSTGLFVELMQHHAHFDPQTAVVTPHIPIQDENPLELATDVGRRWMDLLSHPGFAERLGRSVDIFGIFSEPAGISWRRWRPRAEKICLDIRSRIGREAVCSISGTARGWDVRGLLFDPFSISSVVAEVHNYQGYETTLNRRLNWGWLVGRVPLLVGEFGYTDPPGYIERLLGELRARDISWAAWPGEPILWAQVPNLDRLVREELAR